MNGGERLRLFVALPLPEDAAGRLVAWQREALGAPPGTRPVPLGNLHVTLAFLGGRPATDVEPIVGSLREAAASASPPVLRVAGYREGARVGMLVMDDEDGRAEELAGDVSRRLHALGVYEPEDRRWLPHVTVLRFRERPRLRPALPDLGAVGPSEVALYHSVLRPTGAQYEIRESVALGGSHLGS